MAGVPSQRDVLLKRRLRSWQIFFITLGGIIGVGFFRGSSSTTALAGPGGSMIAVFVVGVIVIAVMEGICEFINIWPIPNAMVEFVRSFVDEDLGIAVGILYWYTYCVSFSALIIVAGDLTAYWGLSTSWKALTYAAAPWVLLAINAAPVNIFGWIEFVGGMAKLTLVVGIIILMCLINAGVGEGDKIGSKYFEDAVQHNENAASSQFVSVSMALPLATFAYIGVELLTLTAFEARDPHELKFPARNIAWFTVVLYCLTTGLIVSNIPWQNRNLPGLFGQALTTITNGPSDQDFYEPDPNANPKSSAAPIIALRRAGFKALPSFLNACLIYSALSCANTALYVASRQLYGLTRSITVTGQSGPLRKFLAWTSGVEFRTKSPWPALIVSVGILYWLPFIRLHEDTVFLQTLQDVIINISSVSAVLVWCSQCVAYFMFYHWRSMHIEEIESRRRYASLTDPNKSGWFRILQPGLAYLGAIATVLIVFVFNTASLWNGKKMAVKATSTFISPFIFLLIWALKKFTRPRRQRTFFVNLSDWSDFEKRIQKLDELIYPGEGPSGGQGVRDEMQQSAVLTPNVDNDDPVSPRSSTDKQPEAYTRSDLLLSTNLPQQNLQHINRAHSVSPVQNFPGLGGEGFEVEANSTPQSNRHSGSGSGSGTDAHSPYARSSLTMQMLRASPVHEVDGGVVRASSASPPRQEAAAPHSHPHPHDPRSGPHHGRGHGGDWDQQQQQQQQHMAPLASATPEGWEQRMAPNGRMYFVNHATRESTWSRPQGWDMETQVHRYGQRLRQGQMGDITEGGERGDLGIESRLPQAEGHAAERGEQRHQHTWSY